MSGGPAPVHTGADLAFRARALAQCHPLSQAAEAVARRLVETDGDRQGLAGVDLWASTALTAGYCLRRVEEALTEEHGTGPRPFASLEQADLDSLAATIGSEEHPWSLLGTAEVTDALDLVIGSEVAKRAGDDQPLPGPARRQLEAYLTWWVVRGYCLRRAETAR